MVRKSLQEILHHDGYQIAEHRYSNINTVGWICSIYGSRSNIECCRGKLYCNSFGILLP